MLRIFLNKHISFLPLSLQMEHTQHQTWHGKVTATLTKAKPDQIWPLFTDFFNLNKWLPTLPTCHGIHGTSGQPGCIRYCAGFSIPPIGDNNNKQLTHTGWSKERLVAVDHVEHRLSYEILDSNTGFKSYVSTVKIVPMEDGGDGCVIEWSFKVDPVEGFLLDDLVNKYEEALQLIAKSTEDHVAEISESKWQGKATVELKDLTAGQVWPSLADFCNLHKWFPNLDTCYQVEGELEQPGLVRYCASKAQPSSGETTVNWVTEKLVMIDPAERCLSYDIVENNMGFRSYAATFKVLELNGDGQPGCRIEWLFTCDPIEGTKLDDFESHCHSVLEFMARKIEDAESSASA